MSKVVAMKPGVDPKLALSATALKKTYGKTSSPALNGLEVHIPVGEFFGLLGANGAGKTTALSIFSGLLPSDSGEILFFGEKIKPNDRRVQEQIGLVPQELALYERLSASENLQYFGRLCGVAGRELSQRVEKCLHFAQLAGMAKKPVASFSGGMKRRLNLAAALLHSPQLLFLDEPTVGIDAQSRALIHSQLLELNEQGITIIYTTHYMEEAQELCSRIGIMEGGKIIATGTPRHLLETHSSRNLEELFLLLTGRQLRDM